MAISRSVLQTITVRDLPRKANQFSLVNCFVLKNSDMSLLSPDKADSEQINCPNTKPVRQFDSCTQNILMHVIRITNEM